MEQLNSWIGFAKERGCSDIHLEPNSPPVFRSRDDLTPVGEVVSGEQLLSFAKQFLPDKQWGEFLSQRSADLSENIAGVRCRLHIYQTMRGVGFAIRILSTAQNSIKTTNLHPELIRFARADAGLVLVCGSTGSGKSTTLAAFVEEINATNARHIVTVEQPVEYFFKNRKSFIKQREVGKHTPSFDQAIVDAMREDPDVLVIGEMRTPDVMRLTLNAAETGHLVYSTIHSSTCAEALSRLCMSFPSDIQPAVCHQVADSLLGVICQRLVYHPVHQIRIPHCEILIANSAVKAIIRMGHFSKIGTALQTGADDGMWTFDRYHRWMEEKKDWVYPTKAATPITKPAKAEPRATVPAAPKPTPKSEVFHEKLPADRIVIDEDDGDLDLFTDTKKKKS